MHASSVVAAAVLAAGTLACATPAHPARREPAVIARGTFEPVLTAQPPAEGDGPVGRLVVDKRFAGDLHATSRGQLLVARFADGSGGYVAMELVTGELGGRRGSFVLQHQGTMRRGAEHRMEGAVVPGSGTGELAGLTGTFTLLVEGGVHRYALEYGFEG